MNSLLGVAAGVQKQQIDIGVGKKPAAPESAGGHQREILWAVRSRSRAGLEAVWRTDDDFAPEPLHDRIDQRRAPGERRAPVAGDGEFLLDGSGFPCVQLQQLAADGGTVVMR